MSTQHRIIADGASASGKAAAWRGLGMVSGNGSSRLLMDYKYRHPEVYEQILQLLFGTGCSAGLTHLKLEMGADINSSSGTEPCTMRTADEEPDVTRGAGFMLAADAKRINPGLTLDLLRWGEPCWVTEAFGTSKEAGFAARYRWYSETLRAAYRTYGLQFDFISPDANEPELADTEWLLYFSEHLRQEQDTPYDFSAIRIVASDETGTCTIAAEMLQNEQLRDAVDVIGLHYTTNADENAMILHEKYGKEIWYSEGIAPCSVPALSVRADGCGMAGSNGVIDTANRIINSYAHSRMVMYEFQPAAAGYYDGVSYFPKQLITANMPWCGHFSADVGFWAAMHFTRFAQPGWLCLDSACFGDGEEQHSIRNTTSNYMTLVSPDKKQFTMHLTNDSAMPRSYLVVLRNLPELPQKLHCVETAGCDDPAQISKHWFRVTNEIRLRETDGEQAFPVVVRPYSMLTVTTCNVTSICGTKELVFRIPKKKRMPLPYRTDFSAPADLLRERGGAPLYTTDQGGAFEITGDDTGNWLEQKITLDTLPTNWRFRGTPEPLTCLGDDHWANYKASAEIEFASDAPENYVSVGLRYNSAVTCPHTSACGFALRLYADGKWELRYMDTVLESGTVPEFRYEGRHTIGIAAIGTLILCFADGHSLDEQKLNRQPVIRSGRMSLQSAYYRNRFYSISAEPMPAFPGVAAGCCRIDCMSEQVAYSERADGAWTLYGMAPYQYYNRTCAEGEPGSVMEIRFYGSGISLLGTTEGASLAVWIDGRLYSESYTIERSRYREAFFTLEPLTNGWHTLKIQILSGKLGFDVFEIPTDDPIASYDTRHFPADPLAPKAVPLRQPLDLKKAALPIAGAAAAGLAIAFTAGQIRRKLKKKRKN
ncbi:MAG: glycosyl hydrolase family 59 [Oscillospiraceae bacterium]|nr:glycosyl hydrolase family 59 [Oscillospiraceae bacterium]